MMNKRNQLFHFLSIFILSLFCCTDNDRSDKHIIDVNEMEEIDWGLLNNKRIFFGHQSLGENIINGINSLSNAGKQSGMRIIQSRDSSDFYYPLFAHTRIGKNLDPESKILDFKNAIENGLYNCVDIAFMKLCYVDINKHTNIDSLIIFYKTVTSELQRKYPQIRILHFTVPLTSKPKGFKGLVKTMLRMDNNLYRKKYNELLRQNFNQKELFDIATIEASYLDGTLNVYNNRVPGLIPEFADIDGGHLNELGSKVVAFFLMKKLTSLESDNQE